MPENGLMVMSDREEVMPWKECSVMDERVQFVARRLAGEPMAELRREFGISPKTATKPSIAPRSAEFNGSPKGAAVLSQWVWLR